MQAKSYILAGAAIFCAATLIAPLNALASGVPMRAGVPAIVYAFSSAFFDDDPQFRVTRIEDGSGFAVAYSWSGENKGGINCTVTVRVRYGSSGDKSKNGKDEEEFTFTHLIQKTDDWRVFDFVPHLDNVPLSDVIIRGHSCS